MVDMIPNKALVVQRVDYAIHRISHYRVGYFIRNLVPRARVPLTSGREAHGLWSNPKPEPGKSWFRFDSARASEIVVEMNKFQQPMRFGSFFGGLSV